jgi:hypothetical protein
MFLLESLRRLRPEWRLVVHSGAPANTAMQRLESEHRYECVQIPPNDSRFDAFLREHKPSVVIFERFYIEEQFGWRVQEHCPEALRILDTTDLHFLRRAREAGQASVEGVPSSSSVVREISGWTGEVRKDFLREMASLLKCDFSWVVSAFEQGLLATLPGFPASRVGLLRWGVEPVSDILPGFDERQGFVMIGNFRHPPNRDSVQWVKRKLWPAVRALLPQAQLHVYGSYPAKQDMELHAPREGFHVHGPWQGDPRALMARHRVLLAPLRFGAGIKGKILDAWAGGAAVLTSVIGAEGMVPERAEFPGEVLNWGESPDIWAKVAVQLHEERPRFETLAQNSRNTLEREYSNVRWAQAMIEDLERGRIGKRSPEGFHWISSVLHEQERNASRHLARYIELKNRGAQSLTPASQ